MDLIKIGQLTFPEVADARWESLFALPQNMLSLLNYVRMGLMNFKGEKSDDI